jgi:hypothetical protein
MTEAELNTIHLLIRLWPVLLFLFGLAAAYGGMVVRLRKIEKAQAEHIVWQAKQEKVVEDLELSISNRLYDSGHEPLFVTVRRCERTHTTMETSIKELVDSHKDLSKAIHMHLGEHGIKG